jgi:glycosyltransferase involved in cell wall biosynthesis
MSLVNRRIYIYAPNIHRGGGRVLLESILTNIPNSIECVLVHDTRLVVNELKGIKISIKPSIFSRLYAELWMLCSVKQKDVVLFFGNLPPLFNLNCKKILYLQNVYLICPIDLKGFTLKNRLRLIVERLWFNFFIKNVSEIIVQTESMFGYVKNKYQIKCSIYSFFARPDSEGIKANGIGYDFIYIASGEPHKNHQTLIDAWIELASEKIYPSILLTLDKESFDKIQEYIKSKNIKLKISNADYFSHEHVWTLYKNAKALIYPSLNESMGLPLLEAHYSGLPIIASESDFVRDVVDPHETFDPKSKKSIARAVKRFLNYADNRSSPKQPSDFIKYLNLESK